VLPTLPVAPRAARSTFAGMDDAERRERLAAAIRAAMAGRTAQGVAEAMEPRRSKETVARWARGETVPSALDVGPLAEALGVSAELFVSPPEVPRYPIERYLLDAAASGAEEGRRRATTRPGGPVPSTPPRRRAQRARGAAG